MCVKNAFIVMCVKKCLQCNVRETFLQCNVRANAWLFLFSRGRSYQRLALNVNPSRGGLLPLTRGSPYPVGRYDSQYDHKPCLSAPSCSHRPEAGTEAAAAAAAESAATAAATVPATVFEASAARAKTSN